jgi:Fic family protein
MPVEVYPLLKEFFRWYSKNKDKVHPVEIAGIVQLRILTIHPFAGGNGRMARLMMNLVLHQNGFPMLDIPYTKRGSYYNALERSQTKGDDHIFLLWFFKMYKVENLRYL